MIKRLVIVGGGTAGWLTAGILAADNVGNNALSVTLIESPDISTVGVGEGTWPTMRSTLKRIGITESDFLRECDASFKQGSKFVGWLTENQADYYYHPFTQPNGYTQANVHTAWRSLFEQSKYDEAVCVQGAICEQGLAPKQITTPEYAGVLNYAYHLDAGKFAQLLQTHCTQKLGVHHQLANVSHVNAQDHGDIHSLVLDTGERIEGDLFIDCSGSNALLIGDHFRVAWRDQSQFSMNDRALAAHVPYLSSDAHISSATIATAQSSGWIWDIGLRTRRGVGYVYASHFLSDDQAWSELQAYIAQTVGTETANELAVKQLTICPGYREKFWLHNCVAIGMSAGFIEPLEASAIALVELSANMIRDELPISKQTMPHVAERFNRIFSYRWQRIIEFLKLHYYLSRRRDTDYWCEATSEKSVPEELLAHLNIWALRPPHYNDLLHAVEIFPSASYQYVLYGMDFMTKLGAKEGDHRELAEKNLLSNRPMLQRLSQNLPDNRQLLDKVAQHGFSKV